MLDAVWVTMQELSLNYSPTLFVQWLWYKHQCFTASGEAFQTLFERVMLKANPDFMQVRPYGNIGDRKCDGLLFGSGTVYQVYSPDEMKQKETIEKIDADLAGAVHHWGDELKKWVFVYNVIKGVPPDVPRHLLQKKHEYPQVEITHLSNDALWDTVCSLDEQKRAEVLGAPPQYKALFQGQPHRQEGNSLAVPQGKSWVVIVQDSLIPVDESDVLAALQPDIPFGAPYYIRATSSVWQGAIDYQRRLVNELLEKSRQIMPPRFAIFSVTPVPYAIHLGFLLSESVQTKYFKLHKDTQSWIWPEVEEQEVDKNIIVEGLPDEPLLEECEVVVRVSLSVEIEPFESQEVVAQAGAEIDMYVANTDLLWLRTPAQVKAVGDAFRNLLKMIRRRIPRCSAIHLFYAGPAPTAVVIGQQINPRMYPPVYVYVYNRQRTPRSELAIVLKEEAL